MILTYSFFRKALLFLFPAFFLLSSTLLLCNSCTFRLFFG